jgi:hypothetical protein
MFSRVKIDALVQIYIVDEFTADFGAATSGSGGFGAATSRSNFSLMSSRPTFMAEGQLLPPLLPTCVCWWKAQISSLRGETVSG